MKKFLSSLFTAALLAVPSVVYPFCNFFATCAFRLMSELQVE